MSPSRRPRTRLALLAWSISLAALPACEQTPPLGLGAGNDDSLPDTDGTPSFGDPIVHCDPDDATACADGQKCTVIEVDGVQNTFDCVDDPGLLLEYSSCIPDPTTGIDGCPPGFACLTTSESDLDHGVCVELCLDDDGCDDGFCLPHAYSQIPTCADRCSPLSPLCPPAQGCFLSEQDFVCRLVTEFDEGGEGEECLFDSGCGPGLVCLQNILLGGCDYDSCCTSVCDLSGADPCDAPTQCNPFLDDPPPYLDGVGACYVPVG